MPQTKEKNILKTRRARRTRSRIQGTSEQPRLSVFRSNQWTYAQLIDDVSGATIASASTRGLKKGTKAEQAMILGETIAKKATEKKITRAVFDKGSYRFHGRVKAVADGARKAGLTL